MSNVGGAELGGALARAAAAGEKIAARPAAVPAKAPGATPGPGPGGAGQEVGINNRTASREGDAANSPLAGAPGKAEGAPAPETASNNGPKIPDSVLADASFITLRDQLRLEAQGKGKVDIAAINKDALNRYYGQWAEARMAEGVPSEVTEDPRYGELIHEETNLASAKLGNGEPLDTAGIQKNALAKYKQEQDLTTEAQQTQGQEIGEAGARIKALEARLESMGVENQQLKEQVGELTLAVSELLPMLRDLAKNQQEMIEDPKKKQSLLEMLVMLAKIAALSVFKEVEVEAKDVVNDKAA